MHRCNSACMCYGRTQRGLRGLAVYWSVDASRSLYTYYIIFSVSISLTTVLRTIVFSVGVSRRTSVLDDMSQVWGVP